MFGHVNMCMMVLEEEGKTEENENLNLFKRLSA